MAYATTNPHMSIIRNSRFEKRSPHGFFFDPMLSAACAEIPRAAKYIMTIATILSHNIVVGDRRDPMIEKEIHIPV